MKGKVFVLEAGDGSGKATQAKLLFERLLNEGYPVKKIEFPNYQSDSSALIKMYLNGEFGNNPSDVNPYVASTFFTVDRYASYKKDWEQFYLQGGIIIADRYTTSNMVHQAAKIHDEASLTSYLNWLWDLEFVKFQLPVPDCVFFLEMPPSYSEKLISDRPNKFGDKDKDIHERNTDYLCDSYRTACKIAEKYGWVKIRCIMENRIRSMEKIHEDVYIAAIRALVST